MNVVSDAVSKPLRLEIFQAATRRGSHDQIRAFRVGTHPEKKRTVASDQSVRDQTLGVSFRFVPNILCVERKRQGEIADFHFARCRILQGDCPQQSIVFNAERFSGLQVFYRRDLSAFTVDTPSVETCGRALLQLDLDAQSGSGDGSE